MKLKRILSVIMSAVMLLSVSFIAFAIDETIFIKYGNIGKNITWEYDETEKVLTLRGEGKLESYHRASVSDTVSGSAYLPDYKEQSKLAEKIIIGDGITEIGDDALSGYFYVREIEFGSNVEAIGNHAFAQLKSLETLTVPSSVRIIDYGAFENCISLRSITLENGVESVGEKAFAGAYILKNVYIPESVNKIGENSFTLFVPGAKYINESETAAIVPDSDVLNSYSFTSYEFAQMYAYYLWLDGDMKNHDAYDEKEILASVYLKFGVSYMNLKELENDFYNNIAIDSAFAEGSVIGCLADSVQHGVCLGSNISHEVSDSDFDCLCGVHNIYENEYIAPTCTGNGYIGGTVCLECEEVIEAPEIISPTGHTDENGDHICDVCGEDIQLSFGERIAEFFKGIVNSILALFRRLFG